MGLLPASAVSRASVVSSRNPGDSRVQDTVRLGELLFEESVVDGGTLSNILQTGAVGRMTLKCPVSSSVSPAIFPNSS